ncbi:prepilin peptidase [Sphingomicrobium aestuariivivum]|uniref:prepilin peptidase n=1 Tax=Sphingomicrobium aestuariivivum TaxID=1582356 RepID=UPI001FD63C91|nr:A24 family peptidase [Sphingomicrobium aestuariivivum]MCJ8191262.1 prepilin peptidase [Sphingomicrobium aestuariivivum]
MILPLPWGVIVGALLGAIVGSFLATIVRRFPEGRSALGGRSACETCGTTLRARDLVPVLSYLLARGRCRHCGAAVASEHLKIELAAAAIGAACLALLPLGQGLSLAFMGWLLLVLGWIDAKHLWLPDGLVVALALAGLLLGEVATGVPLADRLIGGAAGFGFLAALRLAHQRLRGIEGMGAGDPKLMGAIGLWSGWWLLAPILLVASVGLLGVALATGAHREPAREYPLGSALAAAAFAVTLASTLFL